LQLVTYLGCRDDNSEREREREREKWSSSRRRRSRREEDESPTNYSLTNYLPNDSPLTSQPIAILSPSL
jgi:hypothetical protein